VTGQPGPGAAKSEWRQWARRQWGRVDAAALSQLLVEQLAAAALLDEPGTIMLYFPMDGELDLTALVERLPGPVVVTATRTPASGPLTLHRVEGEAMEDHAYGFRQPVATATSVDPAEIDVALVPGLCFARDGTRLGHGAGYFDEFLARCRAGAVLVGVAADKLLVERLPRQPHDIAMTHLASESGVRPIG